MAKTVVFTFGRMNPPTIGHEKLVNKVKAIDKKHGGEPRLYLSHSQDKKKNPHDYNLKSSLAQKAFGIMKKSKAKHAIQIATEISKNEDVDHLVIVVGSDRLAEFKKLLNNYNGKDYNFDCNLKCSFPPLYPENTTCDESADELPWSVTAYY